MFRNRLPRTALASVLAAATISTLAAAPAGAAPQIREDGWQKQACQGMATKLETVEVTRNGEKIEDKEPLQVGDEFLYTVTVTNESYNQGAAGLGATPTQIIVAGGPNTFVNGVEIHNYQPLTSDSTKPSDFPQGVNLLLRWNSDQKNVLDTKESLTALYRHTVDEADISRGAVTTTISFPGAEGVSANCHMTTKHSRSINPSLGGGAIAGIVLGVLSALGLIGGLIASLFARR